MKVLDIEPICEMFEDIWKLDEENNKPVIAWKIKRDVFVINKKDYDLYKIGKKHSLNVYQQTNKSHDFCATVRRLNSDISYIYDTEHRIMGYLYKNDDKVYVSK